MKKSIVICLLSFIIFSLSCIAVSLIHKRNELIKQEQVVKEQEAYFESVDYETIVNELLKKSEWVDVTESDKITFAMGAKTEVTNRVIKALEQNQYVICYVVGGRFDKKAAGEYIILTGFNNEGKVKVMYSGNNYVEENYIFERIFENVNKILLFDGDEEY